MTRGQVWPRLESAMPTAAKPQFTVEQQAALTPQDRSVSLAAGAGCGKTFVLTERFISRLDPRLFEPPAELHELVAITFTDAAAREMRDRVRRRCRQRLEQESDPAEQRSWRRLLRSLDTARISTIHSFCATLIRNHAVELGLDPQFEQLDQSGADLLRSRTLDDRLRQMLLARDERVIQLATRFNLRRLRGHLAELLGENLAPVIERWNGKSPGDLIAAWKQHFQDKSRSLIIADFLYSEPVQTVRGICESRTSTPPDLCALFDRLLALMTELQDSIEPVKLLSELRKLAKVQGPARAKNWADSSDYACFRDACEQLRKLIDKSALNRPWDEEHLLETAETGLMLLDVAADVASCYQLAKQQRGVLEFDDLIQKAHELLTDPRYEGARKQLSKGVRLLLVDEFQDTDPLQESIVQALCGDGWQEHGLFVVGDFKQSIYRFRGAEPEVSRSFRNSLPSDGRLSLTTNFRSQGAILDFVNALFCDSFQGEFEPLRPQRPQLTPVPSVEFLWAFSDGCDDDDTIPDHLGGVKRDRYLEARFIAKRLAELIDSGQPLIVDQETNQLRPARQGDITILLRALSDVQFYETALREQGLNYYLAGGHAFYAQQEIYDILHLLRAVVSMADELSLAGALRSPLFALTDETLFWLVNHKGSLNAALRFESLPKQLDAEERTKVAHARNVIEQLRQAKDTMLVAELLTLAINLTGYDAILLTEFLGERKFANLQKLVEQARTLDRLNPGDLSGFVSQLAEYVARAPKEPLAATSAIGDAIRIMTIHNAKGLEFPLVVLPDLNRKGKGPDQKPVMDESLGPLVPAKAEDKTCVGWNLWELRERHEDQLEMLRLLYVGCTRAADYLILSSSLKDPHKPASHWLKFLNERFDLVTGACRADLPPGYPAPSIRVSTQEPASSREPLPRSSGGNLDKLVEKTQSLAVRGKGVVPPGVAAQPTCTQARRRFSFSRLSGLLETEEPRSETEIATLPQSPLDPTGFGILVHALLERLPLDNPGQAAKLCEFLAPQLLEAPTEEFIREAAAIVQQFVEGPRAQEIKAAKCQLREPEFILPWRHAGEHYLHGFIDMLYQDAAGDWHLLDYKSNQCTAEGVSAQAAQYEMQMFVYTLACEQAVGKRPVEATICFLRPGVEHSFNWSPERESQLRLKLNDAIHRLLHGEVAE